MMNPYKQLNRNANVLGCTAILKKPNGSEINIKVKAEEASTESMTSNYPGAVPIRVWSYVPSNNNKPDAGDALIVTGKDGIKISYSVTRSSATSRYWDYFFPAPGVERVKFYTATNGALVLEG